jgi:hypothetical protein
MKKNQIVRGIVFFTLICIIINYIPPINSQPSTKSEDLGDFLPTWYKTYGGTSGDSGDDVKQTNDGGFIIVGLTESYGKGNSDIWLIKTDAEGNEEWNKTYGGKNIDFGTEVIQTSDGGYLILGPINYLDYYHSTWMIKTDPEGNELWNTSIGGPEAEFIQSFQQTSDGGYILVGYTTSYGKGEADVWLVKTDSNGTEQWNRTFGTGLTEGGTAVKQTSDGGYILVGSKIYTPPGPEDVWVIKTNETGIMEWDRTYGGANDEDAFDVLINPDGSYIIVGSTQSYGVDGTEPIGYATDNTWLLKIDREGTELWNRTYGGALIDYGVGVQPAGDGGYVIAGATGLYMGEWFDIILIKTDPSGYLEWYKAFGGADYDFPNALIVDDDGNYVVVGIAGSFGAGGTDAIMMAFDPKPPGPIRNDAPVCSITSPRPGDQVTGTITVKGTAYDPEGYFIFINARIDDGPWYYALGIENWSVNINTSNFEDGDHTIYARAYDGIDYSDYMNHSVNIIVKNEDKSELELPTEEEDDDDFNIMPIVGIILILIFIALFVIGFMTRKKEPPKGRTKTGRELQDSKINSPLRKY